MATWPREQLLRMLYSRCVSSRDDYSIQASVCIWIYPLCGLQSACKVGGGVWSVGEEVTCAGDQATRGGGDPLFHPPGHHLAV